MKAAAILLAATLVSGAGGAHAAPPCSLPSGAALTIACTIDCGQSVRERVRHAAQALGYAVRFANLHAGENPHMPLPLGTADAVITPGGKDIDPKYYLDAVAPEKRAAVEADYARYGKFDEASHARDAAEAEFFRDYFKNETARPVPVLGICYGLQMLAVANHIPLVVDLPHDLGIPARYNLRDEVTLTPGTEIADLFAPQRVVHGAESHHEAVDIARFAELSPEGVRITGSSNGGRIPEVIEYLHRPALSTQFHPEGSDPEVSDRVFGWLLTRACERRRASAL